MNFVPSVELVTLATALFGGAGATVVWELVLRPTRKRTQLAEVLSAEVSHNINILGAQIVRATARMIHSDFSCSTMVFDATIEDLGLLPSRLIGDVVLLYCHFAELNRLNGAYAKYVDDIRREPQHSALIPQLKAEAQQVIDVFNSSVHVTAERAGAVQPRLLSAAFPWWNSRTWFRRRSRSLDLNEVAANAANRQTQRQAIAKALRERDVRNPPRPA